MQITDKIHKKNRDGDHCEWAHGGSIEVSFGPRSGDGLRVLANWSIAQLNM